MHIRLLILAVLLLGSSLVWGQTPAPKHQLDGIDTLLEQVLADYHVAGFSVAVVHKDSVVYAKGFGYRDYERRLPATSNTLYAIGSDGGRCQPSTRMSTLLIMAWAG